VAPPEDEAGAVDGSDTGLDEVVLTAADVPLRPMLAEDILPFLVMVLGACAGSCAVAALWLLLLRASPKIAIWSMIVSFILAQIGFGVYILIGGNGFGILVILLAGFSCLMAVILKRWMPFAMVMLQLTMDVLSRSPLLMDLSMGTLAVQVRSNSPHFIIIFHLGSLDWFWHRVLGLIVVCVGAARVDNRLVCGSVRCAVGRSGSSYGPGVSAVQLVLGRAGGEERRARLRGRGRRGVVL
jgi:hypothetical protein